VSRAPFPPGTGATSLIDDLLGHWFGKTRSDPLAIVRQQRLWFGADDDTPESRAARDAELRAQFGAAVDRALAGGHQDWVTTPAGTLALILLLDQLPRNLFRGTARAFAGDALARDVCEAGLARGDDQQLTPIERVFFYLPLEHAEDLAAQQRAVSLFLRLKQAVPAEERARYAGFAQYAEVHRDLIARFGRFPHRNAVLDRASTADEIAYLENGERFGQ